MRNVLHIFGLLTDSDIDWLAQVGIRRRLNDGETLIESGKPIDSIALVLEGELLVLMQDLAVVAQRGVGEVIGEISMVDSAPPSANVVAQGECLVLLLNKKALRERLAADLAFGSRFYRALAIFLAHRLRELQRDLLGEPRETLAGENVQTGELNGVIAENAGMTGERLNRMLKVLTAV
jgi:CRP-like cAMP-binding protein